MTRNWRVDEEALIPNWKGFNLFLAPLQPSFLFHPPSPLFLYFTLSFIRSFSSRTPEHVAGSTNEHWPEKKSDNVLILWCDLTCDFARKERAHSPSFLGVRCSKLSKLPREEGLGFKESPLAPEILLKLPLSARADPALLLLPVPPLGTSGFI